MMARDLGLYMNPKSVFRFMPSINVQVFLESKASKDVHYQGIIEGEI